MNSLVVYYSSKSAGSDYQQLFVGSVPAGFVRGEVHEDKDVIAALEAAAPRSDETVLNSVEISNA